jgi:hypothetical protein
MNSCNRMSDGESDSAYAILLFRFYLYLRVKIVTLW